MSDRTIEWLGRDGEEDFQVYNSTHQTYIISEAFFKHVLAGTMTTKMDNEMSDNLDYQVHTCLLPWEFME